jgi:iron complex outermembrane recepter protein
LGYGSAANELSGGASIDAPLNEHFVVHIDGSYRTSDDLQIGGYLLSPTLRQDAVDFAADQTLLGNAVEAANAVALTKARGRLPNSGVTTWTAGAGAAFINDDGNLGASFNIYDTQYGIAERPEFGAQLGGDSVSIDLRQYRFDFRGEIELGDGFLKKLRLRTGYANYAHLELEGAEIGTQFESKAIESRLELTQNNRGGWRGASGIQYTTRDFTALGDEAFVPPTRSNQIGLFSLQEFGFGNLEAEIALRFDHASLEAQTLGITRSFNNVSAALGIAYKIGDLKIGTNISRTGRAPSVEELYSNGPHVATQSFEVGALDLRSERSWNGEIYARFDSTRVDFNATFYVNRFGSFIYESATNAVEDDLPVFQYFQRKAKVWGIEAEANVQAGHWAGFDFVINGVADYTRASVHNAGSVPRIPPLRLLTGLEMQSGNLDLRGEFEWTDSQNRIASFETPTTGFKMVNASATWRPFGKTRNISVILLANNIFDVEARRAASFTKDFVSLAGRDLRLSLRISF